jgi:hypothetical protein
VTAPRFEHIPTPPEAGKVVAICTYRGRVIVACEFALLEFFHEAGGEPTLSVIRHAPLDLPEQV